MKNQLLNKNFILIVSLAATIYVASNMLITTLPKYAVEQGHTKLTVGALMLVYTLSACVTRIFWGRVADNRGRMAVVYIGIGISLVAVALMFFNSSVVMIFISRSLFGVGFSAVVTACATLSTEVVPDKYMSKAIAIYGLGGVLTQAVAPPLALYLYNYGLVVIVGTAALFLLVGVILAKSVKMSSYGKSNKLEVNKIKFEKQKRKSFEWLAALPSFIAGIITFSTAGIFSFVPLLTVERGVENVSGFFIASSTGLLLSRLIFVRVSEKISHDKLFYSGIIIFTSGFLLLAFADCGAGLVGAGALYGYGLGTVHPILNTKAVSRVAKENRAGAMAIFYTFQDMGVAVGSIVCGFLADKFTLKTVFLTCAFTAFFSIIPYFLTTKKQASTGK